MRYTSCYKGYDQSIPFDMHGIPKWIVDDMIQKLAKIQAGSKILLKYKIISKTIVTLLLQKVKMNVKSTHVRLTKLKICQTGQAKMKSIW